MKKIKFLRIKYLPYILGYLQYLLRIELKANTKGRIKYMTKSQFTNSKLASNGAPTCTPISMKKLLRKLWGISGRSNITTDHQNINPHTAIR